MPGAISRTTGSATRWNSFHSPFMRQGRVQPFSVTTGWYCWPEGGATGGCMRGESVVGASGMVAAWERPPIAATLTSATADPPRKLRRENFMTLRPCLLCIR